MEELPINPYSVPSPEYQQIRPNYPSALLERIRDAVQSQLNRADTWQKAADCADSAPLIAELGAGTGILTRQLLELVPGARIFAVEPSAQMRANFAVRPGANLTLCETSAEAAPYPENLSAAVCAQAWHWFDQPQVLAKLTPQLSSGAQLWIIFNQLDVRQPWVHRLSRIMRSGDIHHLRPAPQLGQYFSAPTLETYYWNHPLRPSQIMELGRTRSSYLLSDADGRKRMQENLRWYLKDHLHLGEVPVPVPYLTLVWRANKVQP